MTASKHTPGPWQVAHSNAGAQGRFVWRNDEGPGEHETNSNYARICRNVSSDANARLIAAAPELLEALRWFLEDERFQVAVGGNPNVVDRMLDQARAAIAKATGA